VFDLVFFDPMKKLKGTVPGEFGEDSMDEQILKLLKAYEQTATSMTIRDSFQKTGIYPIVESGALKVNFDEEKLRNNARLKELWELNISIVELS
jgi:ABC-type thiamine transport system substrate-binding protein